MGMRTRGPKLLCPYRAVVHVRSEKGLYFSQSIEVGRRPVIPCLQSYLTVLLADVACPLLTVAEWRWWYSFTVEVLLLSFGMAGKKGNVPAPSASPNAYPVLATVHGVASVSRGR